MKKLSLFSLLLFPFFSRAQVNYAQYVDPMIGTGGHGHTFPGATVPFGMVQLSPDTRIDGSWDGCSGYHYSDTVIYGFSHTHLSGTGCSDYGDVMLMPMTGKYSTDEKEYSSGFSHRDENARAGFYSVKLKDDNIDVFLTATARVGMHKYVFNREGKGNIILDLRHRDKLLEGKIKVIDDSTVEGLRRSEAWAHDQVVYFRIRFSKPFITHEAFFDSEKNEGVSINDQSCIFSFGDVKKGEAIMVKVSLSAVDYEGAQKNMETELPGWDFEKVRKDAETAWNKELSKIEVKDNDPAKLKIFYTALYHCMIQPNIYSDVDHRYRGRDNKIHTAEGFDYYTVFSLWDTFRAEHPLFTIIDTRRTSDFINTFIAQYEQGGKLPVWELSSNETECMIGYHCVSVIADAMAKGIKGFDYEKAYQACRHSAMLDNFGLKYYKQKGFISSEEEGESVSRTLEYAYDDWCISQMARMLKKDSDYVYFSSRAQNWKNVFDPGTGFMRPRKNGGWLTPFDPKEVNNNYTEGNAWQYTFFVLQDVQGLIGCMGGPQKFEAKLDELFSSSSRTTGREQPDITGLIGQYAHGNEPSHHMAYLYDYVGRPDKTQAMVHRIMNDFYKTGPDGLIGNEDCGQMSAWYVLGALGFYQVSPGSQQFAVGTPSFSEVLIHLGNGKTLSINASGNAGKNFYISESNFNSTNHDMAYLSYGDISNGGEFVFTLAEKPVNPDAHSWGRPVSFYRPFDIVAAPVISAPSKTFADSIVVGIQSSPGDTILYKVENKNTDTPVYSFYAGPLIIKQNSNLEVFCRNGGEESPHATAVFYKRPNRWKISVKPKCSPQYTADGEEGLIDGLHGDVNWRKGGWQGYQGQDFEAVIDLGKEQAVQKFTAEFLQDEKAWIMMPTKVEYYFSADGKNFTSAGIVNSPVEDKDSKVQVRDFALQLKDKVNARYIKVKAYNYGKLPSWHEGSGKDAWLFADEITV